MSRSNRNKAFTLVEVLVVVGIVSLLMGIVLPAINRVRETSRRTSCMANLRAIGLLTPRVLPHYHRVGLGEYVDLPATDALTLHYDSRTFPIPSLPAVPVFDDANSYYSAKNPTASVITPIAPAVSAWIAAVVGTGPGMMMERPSSASPAATQR